MTSDATGTYYLHCDHPTHTDPLYYMQYVNHSCNPNCVLEIWRDHRGWLRAILVAHEPIFHLQKLSFHYQWTAPSLDQCTPCQCGLKVSHVIEKLTPHASSKIITGTVAPTVPLLPTASINISHPLQQPPDSILPEDLILSREPREGTSEK